MPQDEFRDIQRVTELFASKFAVVTRDAHPKHHGLVRAVLEVVDDLPADLAQGLFSRPGCYDAYLRFSNASPTVTQPDWNPDFRGLGVKVIGVDGSREVIDQDDERETQDFVLASDEVFFVKDANDYVEFMKVLGTRDRGGRELFLRYPLAFLGREVHRNPLQTLYFSQTPYALGDELAVRYRVVPLDADGQPLQRAAVFPTAAPRPSYPDDPDPATFPADYWGQLKAYLEALAGAEAAAKQAADPFDEDRPNLDYLSQQMAEWLAAKEAPFLFQVQRKPTDADLEEPRVPWDADWVTVGRIRIPAQDFQTETHWELAEHLSFNPWTTLTTHRPLGGINRTRRRVYRTTSRLRHDANRVAMREPSGLERLEATQRPLNLIMPLAPGAYASLSARLHYAKTLPPHRNPFNRALTTLETVHFARLLFLGPAERAEDDSDPPSFQYLGVITSYDGTLDDYVLGFVNTVGELFDVILAHVADWPGDLVPGWSGARPPSVAEHPSAFLRYVRAHDEPGVGSLFSAYPELSVPDIKALRRQAIDGAEGGGRWSR